MRKLIRVQVPSTAPYAWIAQTVEQLAVNQWAVGSSPTLGANDIIIMKQSIRILRGEIGILKRLLIFSLERACGFKSRRTQRADVQIGFSTPYQHSHYVISYHGNAPCCQTTSFRGVRCSPPFFSSDPAAMDEYAQLAKAADCKSVTLETT